MAPDEEAYDVREERLRFEVLETLYGAAGHCADVEIDVGGFVRRLGVWEDELLRALAYLTGRGYVHSYRTADGLVVCLTVKGVDYIQRDARRRRTIRDS